MRQRNIVRRALINELHFTNKKMVQLLPTLASRAGQGRTGQLLRAQSEVDRTIGLRLKNTAVEHGDPPSPCLCEEAQALLANVYYADRNKADKWVRHRAVIQALKAVRVYMIRSWGALIDRLAAEGEELFQQEASALQQVEASLHRELVQLANKLEGELPNA
jgi:hypothetical protein